MFLETGFAKDSEDEYKSRTCVHMDCFRWVQRDSYLPQGTQGLKAVTTAKLGYNPIELDPELITIYAMEFPQVLAPYSVSDAVSTCYLHEEVQGNMYNGHLLASETYVGGYLEALEADFFRSGIGTDIKIVPSTCQQLIDDLDAALKFCFTEESKYSPDQVAYYEEVRIEITPTLKDRYAAFNDHGSLAELQGLEAKCRRELQLIKIFHSQILEKFLLETATQNYYAAVAQVADQWLDILFSEPESLTDDDE